MSVYSEASKADQKKIRRQMIATARIMLPANLRRNAVLIVDNALAKEKHEQTDSSDAQQPA